jgi:hypothetical protein
LFKTGEGRYVLVKAWLSEEDAIGWCSKGKGGKKDDGDAAVRVPVLIEGDTKVYMIRVKYHQIKSIQYITWQHSIVI